MNEDVVSNRKSIFPLIRLCENFIKIRGNLIQPTYGFAMKYFYHRETLH